jgi:minor histocompatibility antigen H13
MSTPNSVSGRVSISKEALKGQPNYEVYPEGNTLLTLAYLALFAFWAAAYFVEVPVGVALVTMSTCIIYIGSHRSSSLLALKDDGTAVIERETITKDDAMKFPIMGSISLFGLYCAFKYLDKNMVNLILGIYFSVIGVFTIAGVFAPIVGRIASSPTKYGTKFTLPLIGEIDGEFTVADLISVTMGAVFSYYYFTTKHFLLNNLFGISFCIQALEKISIGSYKVGAILLVGLFFYDIFWVFGTDVMVTVAKSFDGPIKLLFPRKLPELVDGVWTKGEFSLLGLGDIVIPGLFVSILYRLDVTQAYVAPKLAEYTSFPKPFFMVNIVFYALGLISTVLVMYFFEAAQPALLYLVPACLLGSLISAAYTGKFGVMYGYDEEQLATKDGEEDGKEKAE